MNPMKRSFKRGCRPLRLPMICVQLLTRRLRLISVCDSGGDEALRRLKMDAAHIENCLRRAQNQAQVCLPAGNNGVSILDLVRTLLAKGEKRLTKETLCRETTETDAGMMLEIRELECLPDLAAAQLSFDIMTGKENV